MPQGLASVIIIALVMIAGVVGRAISQFVTT
jgi:hypothetical protein